MKFGEKKSSMATQMRFCIMIFGMLCVLATGSILTYFSYKKAMSDLERHLHTQARAAALEIDSYIDDLLRKLDYLARVRGLTEFPAQSRQNLLQALVRHNKAYELVVIVNSLGEIASHASEFGFKPEETVVDHALYYKTYQQKENYIGIVTIDPNLQLPVMDIGVPIRNSQDLVNGILWARVNLRFLWYVLSDIDIGKAGTAYILDHRNVMIAQKGAPVAQLSPVAPFKKGSNPGKAMGDGLVYKSRLSGEKVVATAANIGSVKWQMVLELPVDEANAQLIRMIQAMGAVMVAMVILGVLISLWISGKLIKPLMQLTEAAGKIASGRRGVKVEVPSGYELGVLADTFNRMTRELEDGLASLRTEILEREKAQYAVEREAAINAAMARLSNSLISLETIEKVSTEVLACGLRLTRSVIGFAGYSKKHAGSIVCTTVVGDLDGDSQSKQDATEEFIRLWDKVQSARKPLVNQEETSRREYEPYPFSRYIVAPSMVGPDLLGQIAVANAAKQYTSEDFQIIEQLADLYAIAIQRKLAEEKLNSLNEELEFRVQERTAQLEAANRELAAFSYSVSHDLRSPLRAIDGFSQALLDDYHDKLDEDARDFLFRVRNATQHMGRMVDDILQLLGITRQEMKLEKVDLSSMMQNILQELQQKEPQRKVAISVEDNLTAIGDKRLLHRLLANLAQNAWKFTSGKENTRIEFGQTQVDDKSVFFIRDNGVGFDMAYANKLFKAFNRLHTNAQYDGRGVGLAIIERIVKRHKGKVWAYGKVGEGAVFYFSLSD